MLAGVKIVTPFAVLLYLNIYVFIFIYLFIMCLFIYLCVLLVDWVNIGTYKLSTDIVWLLVLLQFLSWYSMAALRLNASIRAVSWRVKVLPTLRTSIPSVVIPTPSSGWSLMPFSMISAVNNCMVKWWWILTLCENSKVYLKKIQNAHKLRR